MTKKILEKKMENINTILGVEGKGAMFLEFAYGGVRLCKSLEMGGCSDISPRVKNAEMANILDTLEMAIYKMNLHIK